jgi:hypothetical protein
MTDVRQAALQLTTEAMLKFASTLSATNHFSPHDVAKLMISTGALLLANELGRASAVQQLRELATRLEAGATPAELN